MIRCSKCNGVTKNGESTGLVEHTMSWTDKKGKTHVDLTGVSMVCNKCNGVKDGKETKGRGVQS